MITVFIMRNLHFNFIHKMKYRVLNALHCVSDSASFPLILYAIEIYLYLLFTNIYQYITV